MLAVAEKFVYLVVYQSVFDVFVKHHVTIGFYHQNAVVVRAESQRARVNHRAARQLEADFLQRGVEVRRVWFHGVVLQNPRVVGVAHNQRLAVVERHYAENAHIGQNLAAIYRNEFVRFEADQTNLALPDVERVVHAKSVVKRRFGLNNGNLRAVVNKNVLIALKINVLPDLEDVPNVGERKNVLADAVGERHVVVAGAGVVGQKVAELVARANVDGVG